MQKEIGERRSFWLLLGLALAAFYVAAALLEGYRLYPDSQSYIEMSLAREPLYSLFLALVRRLFGWGGESFWLTAAAVIQSLVTAWAGLFFTRRCAELFRLRSWEAGALAACTLLPALLCRFLANRRAMYSYSIISESLALPLYLVFFALLLAYALRGRRGDLLLAALVSFLLISLRKQMVVTLPLMALALLWRGVRGGRLLLRAVLAVLLAAAVLLGSSLLDRAYNRALRGEALSRTGDMRFVTTMLLYTAEPSDAEAIEEPELRELFTEILHKADGRRLLRSYAPAGWFARSLFFMNNYDLIQYECLRDTINARSPDADLDGTEAALARDRVYDALNAALLPVGWTRLLRTAADSFGMGLVNTVAAMKRAVIPAVVLLYAAYVALFVLCIRRRREDEAVCAALALLSILGNVALVSLTIFCQPRYTLYNMPIFYAALLLLLRGLRNSTRPSC